MKNTINYYYNLNLEYLNEQNNICSFEINKINYYFVPYLRPEEELKKIYVIVENLLQKQNLCHSFILNKENKLLTMVNDQFFIMLKVNDCNFKEKINLQDIAYLNSKFIVNSTSNYQNNWGELWSQKIDYFEYQIRELGKGKEIILNSFSYYVGLTENAITYFNNTAQKFEKNSNDIISVAHKRIFYPNIKLNYNNPLNFIVDLEVRDVAEYIKSLFFANQDPWSEIELYFKTKKLSNYSCNMLFARLLYPSYYFDMYEDILNDKKREDELLQIIVLVNEYEIFLSDMYNFLSKNNILFKLDWLTKALN